MKKKIIQLPKGYLSYSQIQMWKKDRERYEHIYFDGEKANYTNDGMEYGREVASMLEDGVESDDALTNMAMALLPKYDIRDQEIRTEFNTKDGWVGILGRPDTMDSRSFAFREYKTGKTKWTQSKAQRHPQLKFYQMLIYVAHGTLLRETYLDWIETEKVEEFVDGIPVISIKPTGRVESFRVILTMNDLLETMAETTRVAREIELAWIMRGQQGGTLPPL